VTKPLLHLWSLGIEEQYYIIWPMLVYLAWRRHISFLILVGTITAISFATNVHLLHTDLVQTFFSPLTRFWELLMGSLLAYLTLHKISLRDIALHRLGMALGKSDTLLKSTGAWLCHAQPILGALLIGIAVLLVTKESAFPGWWALLPTMGAYLIISAGQHSWLNRTVLSNRVVVWIGLISYPLYLWHWPILSFLRITHGNNEVPLIYRFGAVITAIFLAWLTFMFLERSIRGRKNNIHTALILMATIMFVGVLGFVVHQNDGYPKRIPKEYLVNRDQLVWDASFNSDESCSKKFPDGQYCKISNIQVPPNVVLLGDSHANQFYLGLEKYYSNSGRNLINLGRGGALHSMELMDHFTPQLIFNA
jgi:peptidoglycan/LPS O-acetylase OafA/YrhL